MRGQAPATQPHTRTCFTLSGRPGCRANTEAAPGTLAAAACRPRPGCSSFSRCSMVGVTKAAAARAAPSASARSCRAWQQGWTRRDGVGRLCPLAAEHSTGSPLHFSQDSPSHLPASLQDASRKARLACASEGWSPSRWLSSSRAAPTPPTTRGTSASAASLPSVKRNTATSESPLSAAAAATERRGRTAAAPRGGGAAATSCAARR